MTDGFQKLGGFDKYSGRNTGFTHYDYDVYAPTDDLVFDVKITAGLTSATPPPLTVGEATDVGTIKTLIIYNADSVAHDVEVFDARGLIAAVYLASGGAPTPVFPTIELKPNREFVGPFSVRQATANGAKANGYSVRVTAFGRVERVADASTIASPPDVMTAQSFEDAIPFLTPDPNAGATWNPIPATYTELLGGTFSRTRVDFLQRGYCGFSVMFPGPATVTLGVKAQYSLDDGTSWADLYEYVPQLADVRPYWTGWQPVPAAARAANVLVRFVAKGDAATSASIGPVILFVK